MKTEYEKQKEARKQDGIDRPLIGLVDAWKKFEQAVGDLRDEAGVFEFETGKNLPLEGYPFRVDLIDVANIVAAYRERLERGDF